MIRQRLVVFAFLMTIVGMSLTAAGQGRPDQAALIAAQREAMAPLAIMDGVWRGPAWTILPPGQKHVITQTEGGWVSGVEISTVMSGIPIDANTLPPKP